MSSNMCKNVKWPKFNAVINLFFSVDRDESELCWSIQMSIPFSSLRRSTNNTCWSLVIVCRLVDTVGGIPDKYYSSVYYFFLHASKLPHFFPFITMKSTNHCDHGLMPPRHTSKPEHQYLLLNPAYGSKTQFAAWLLRLAFSHPTIR
jgi:hypothetical protein